MYLYKWPRGSPSTQQQLPRRHPMEIIDKLKDVREVGELIYGVGGGNNDRLSSSAVSRLGTGDAVFKHQAIPGFQADRGCCFVKNST